MQLIPFERKFSFLWHYRRRSVPDASSFSRWCPTGPFALVCVSVLVRSSSSRARQFLTPGSSREVSSCQHTSLVTNPVDDVATRVISYGQLVPVQAERASVFLLSRCPAARAAQKLLDRLVPPTHTRDDANGEIRIVVNTLLAGASSLHPACAATPGP
jgi:hypothetical protein